jgi:hypothetical protein
MGRCRARLHGQTAIRRDKEVSCGIRGDALTARRDELCAIREDRDEVAFVETRQSTAGGCIKRPVSILVKTHYVAAGQTLRCAERLKPGTIVSEQPVLRSGPEEADAVLEQTQWHQIGQPFGLSVRLKTVLLGEANLHERSTSKQDSQVPEPGH